MIGRAFYLLVAGAVGGLLAWMATEPFAPRTYADVAWTKFTGVFGLVAGLSIGLFVGAASGWAQGSKSHALRGAAIGGLLGAVAGSFGVAVGSTLFRMVVGPTESLPGVNVVTLLIGRALGWSVFGALIGAAEGAVGRSTKRAFQGLMGGLLGGALGGIMFEVSAWLVGPATVTVRGGDESGSIPRAIGLVSVGAGIGLLIGIVEALSRQAWIRLVVGRNEGREWPIDAPVTWLGRSETAHIPLFGDPNVAPNHAAIERKGGVYWLSDAGSPLGTGLNGVRISQVQLTSGDQIQIGSHTLLFLLRSGRGARVAGPERFHAQPIPHAQAPGGQGVAVGMGFPGPSTMAPATRVFVPGGMAPTQAFPASPSQPTMAQPVAAGATLVAVSGPLTGQRFPVLVPCEIGRETPTVPLGFDSMASRRHASLQPQPGGLLVTDLGSKNGTLVNGQPVQSQLARAGDTIQIGSTTFRVE